MSERKVLNKYFPPDFDPSKLKRRRNRGAKAGMQQMTVRLMAPFSMRCSHCGEYIYKGKKFNARKETATGDEYLGIKVFRFYIKCPVCSSEITFKTDPRSADFVAEHGATRNFESWAEDNPDGKVGALPTAADDEEFDDEGNDRATRDAMADLEKSQEASRREMEVMDELADLRSRNARLETSSRADDPEALLAALHAERESKEEEERRRAEEDEDDAEVAKYFARVGAEAPTKGGLEDLDEDDEDEPKAGPSAPAGIAPSAVPVKVKRTAAAAVGEPTVAAVLAAKGKVDTPVAPPPVKRKRGDMQKLLGIKKKVKA